MIEKKVTSRKLSRIVYEERAKKKSVNETFTNVFFLFSTHKHLEKLSDIYH